MMKFNEILEAIDKLYAEVQEAKKQQETEIERYYATFDGLSFREKIEKRKENKESEEEHMKKIAVSQDAITDGTLKLKLLQNNAKIALFNEVMPIVLEVYAKYNGKPYGKKTEEKIRNEIREKTNCRVYMDAQSFSVYPLDAIQYDFQCGTKYIDGEKKPLLVNNKIHVISMEDLELYYINRTYFDDLDKTVSDLKRLHAEAKKKQDELKEICDKFNKLTVEGIAGLNHTSYSIGDINYYR